MAVVINTTLKADTKDAVKQVEILKKEVEKVGKAAKKSGEDISAAMQIGNEATRSLDKVSGGLASKLVKVAKAAKLSGKAMKTALISSGIGAAVVALGLIVEYWDDISETLGFVNKDLERQVELNAENLKLTTEQLSEIDLRIKLEKKQGGNADELIKKRKELIKLQKAQILLSIADLKTQELDLTNEAKKVGFWERFSNDFMKRTAGMNKVTRDMMGKITDEENKLIEGKKTEIRDLEMLLLNIKIAETPDKVKPDSGETEAEKLAEQQRLKEIEDKASSIEEITKLEDDYLQSKLSKEQQEINAARDKYFTLIEEAEKYGLDTTLLEEARLSEINAIEKKYEDEAKEKRAEKRETNMEAFNQRNDDRLKRIKENAERELEIQQDLADAEANILDAKLNFASSGVELLGKLAGDSKAMSAGLLVVEKGLAIADVIINASRAIAAAKANLAATPAVLVGVPNPLYAVQAATTAKGILSTKLSAAASIATIAAQAIPGLAGGGGGGGSTSGLGGGGDTGAQPPAFNVVGASGETQLADAIGGQTQRPARAYVVSNDVTTAQEMDRNIIEGASIG